MIIGLLGIQGDLEEHAEATRKAFLSLGLEGRVLLVRTPEELRRTDALIISGGESTTMWKLLKKSGLFEDLRMYQNPLFGTCAGLILLASGGVGDSEKTGQEFLGKIDAVVNRNAFGRQRESFSVDIEFDDFSSPFHAVFIRAPVIESLGPRGEVLSTYNGKIVAARQDHVLITAFHPELTDDVRVHEYFIRMAASSK